MASRRRAISFIGVFVIYITAASAAGPVDFARDVAPLLAMRCANCHGLPQMNPAGNFSVRTYAALMEGGNLGRVIVPGSPERSILLSFLDGSRGENQRMPSGAPPLSAAELDLLRRWIAAGARAADAEGIAPRLSVTIPAQDPMPIVVVSTVEALVRLRIRDAARGTILHTQEAPVRNTSDRTSAARPGSKLTWTLHLESGWPERLRIEAEFLYAAGPITGSTLMAAGNKGVPVRNKTGGLPSPP